MTRAALFAAALLLAGCTSTGQQAPSITPAQTTPAAIVASPVAAPAFFVRGLGIYRNNGWDRLLATAITDLGRDLLASVPTDIASYCPAYPAMTSAQRLTVWQNLFIALTKFESDYDLAVSFNETNVDPTLVERDGSPVISRGLLQISIGSANLYGCGITAAEQLHDPATNLRCAVRIANNWVRRDGVVAGGSSGQWRGMARYWSPFRRADRLSDIQLAVRSTPSC